MPASRSSSTSCHRFGWRGGRLAADQVRVRELVDEQDAGSAFERSVEVELLAHHAAVCDRQRRQRFEAFCQPLGIGSAVRLDVADDDLEARELRRLRRAQHRERLADAGRSAEEDAQPAAPRTRLLCLDLREQLVGIGPRLDCHQGASSPSRGRRAPDSARAHGRAARRKRRTCGLAYARGRGSATSLAGRVRARATRAIWYSAAAKTDMRIEPAGRRGDEIDGHAARRCRDPLCAAPRSRSATASASAGLKRALVRAARHRAVVGHRPGRGRPAPEVLRRGERLAEQPRADGPAVALDDAAVRPRSRTRAARSAA